MCSWLSYKSLCFINKIGMCLLLIFHFPSSPNTTLSSFFSPWIYVVSSRHSLGRMVGNTFFFFLGHLYPVRPISVYFLHLASVHRKPGISNPFTLQIFLFCDNIETFQRNGLEGTPPTPPCNLSSDMFEQYEIYNYKSLSNGLVPDQRLRINLYLLWVLFPEILVS